MSFSGTQLLSGQKISKGTQSLPNLKIVSSIRLPSTRSSYQTECHTSISTIFPSSSITRRMSNHLTLKPCPSVQQGLDSDYRVTAPNVLLSDVSLPCASRGARANQDENK